MKEWVENECPLMKPIIKSSLNNTLQLAFNCNQFFCGLNQKDTVCQSSELILNIKYKHIMQNGELYLQQENWLKVKLSAFLQDDCLASLVSHFLNLWAASHLSALKKRKRNKGGDLGKCMSCLFWMSFRNISPLLQL